MAAETISIERGFVRFPVRAGFFRRATRYVHAVDDVSLALHENETVALVGESGSGKTTLGMALLGLNELSEGTIRWRGRNVSELTRDERKAFREDVQIVFQDPYASLNPRMSIGETLLRPLRLHRTVPPRRMLSFVEEMLDRVGLRPANLYIDRYPHEFSGGQRQRVAIARALILNPRVVVADEPVSALDVSIRAQILNLLKLLKSDLRLSMLFLSHDLGVVRFIADRIAVMYLGKLVEIGPAENVFETPRHPYTRLLLQSAPAVRRKAASDAAAPSIVGEPPDPTDPPSGCRFRTRCPHAFDRCAAESPPLLEVGADHRAACHLNEGASPDASVRRPVQGHP
jgi:peptide/nickel transport system ATP-binding protein